MLQRNLVGSRSTRWISASKLPFFRVSTRDSAVLKSYIPKSRCYIPFATSAKNDATANRGYRHSTASNILSIQNINRKSNRGISTAYKGDFTPTVEQQAILDCFAEGKHNIFINACVGSGKTTLCLELALRNPNLHTCLVVFNRRLADETRQKVSDRGIKNIKIYTIHELATRYYSSACHTDEGLRRVVWHNMPPCESPEMFDVLIVDEAQDLSPVTYNFIRHHYKHAANQNARLVLVGDERQEVYGHLEADHRFLRLGDKAEVFGSINALPSRTFSIDITQRLTPLMVRMMNRYFCKPDRKLLVAERHLHPGSSYSLPEYIICDSKETVREMIDAMLKKGVLPGSILVVAPSIRVGQSGKDTKGIINELAQKGYPLFVASESSSEVSASTSFTEGKIVFCSYHQSKGLERPHCFVLGFDDSCYRGNIPVSGFDFGTNAQYVALTRASEHMTVAQHQNFKPLIDLTDAEDYFQIKRLQRGINTSQKSTAKPASRTRPSDKEPCKFGGTVSELAIRKLSRACISRLIDCVVLEEITPPGYPLEKEVGTVQSVHGLTLEESVNEITGAAVGQFFEMRRSKTCAYMKTAVDLLDRRCRTRRKDATSIAWYLSEQQIDKIERIISGWAVSNTGMRKELSTEEILFLANLHLSARNKTVEKLYSIPLDSYNWLSESFVDDVVFTIYEHMPKGTWQCHEEEICRTVRIELPNSPYLGQLVRIIGCIDICSFDNDMNCTVFELKHSSALGIPDIIQAAIYTGLKEGKSPSLCYDAKVLNTKTGHCVRIKPKGFPNFQHILQIVAEDLMSNTAGQTTQALSDQEFLEECSKGFKADMKPLNVPDWLFARPTAPKMFYYMRMAARRKMRKDGAGFKRPYRTDTFDEEIM